MSFQNLLPQENVVKRRLPSYTCSNKLKSQFPEICILNNNSTVSLTSSSRPIFNYNSTINYPVQNLTTEFHTQQGDLPPEYSSGGCVGALLDSGVPPVSIQLTSASKFYSPRGLIQGEVVLAPTERFEKLSHINFFLEQRTEACNKTQRSLDEWVEIAKYTVSGESLPRDGKVLGGFVYWFDFILRIPELVRPSGLDVKYQIKAEIGYSHTLNIKKPIKIWYSTQMCSIPNKHEISAEIYKGVMKKRQTCVIMYAKVVFFSGLILNDPGQVRLSVKFDTLTAEPILSASSSLIAFLETDKITTTTNFCFKSTTLKEYSSGHYQIMLDFSNLVKNNNEKIAPSYQLYDTSVRYALKLKFNLKDHKTVKFKVPVDVVIQESSPIYA